MFDVTTQLMGPFAIPLEDRRSSGMAVYVKGVSSDEDTKNTWVQTAVLANGETSSCPSHTLPAGIPVGYTQLVPQKKKCWGIFLPAAAPAPGVQESGAPANVWSQYFEPLWTCDCRRAWGESGCLSSHRVNGERDKTVRKTTQSTYIQCLKLDSVHTPLGSLCCLR